MTVLLALHAFMALWKVWERKQRAHSVSSVRGTKAGGRGGTEHVDHQELKDKALIKKGEGVQTGGGRRFTGLGGMLAEASYPSNVKGKNI